MAQLLKSSVVGTVSLCATAMLTVVAIAPAQASVSAAQSAVSSTSNSVSRASKPVFKQSAARYGVTSSKSVRNMQSLLIRKGYATAGLRSAGATGSYLKQTRKSVKKFGRKIGYGQAAATGIIDARGAKKLGLRWVADGNTSTVSSVDLPTGTNGAALSASQLKSVLYAAGFREPSIRTAFGIAMRESRAYPRVVSPKNSNGTRDHGLFQINDVHRATTDFTRIYDAVYNAQVAFRLSSGGNDFSAWGIGDRGWAGTLKRTQPAYWQFLQDEMARFRAQYPG